MASKNSDRILVAGSTWLMLGAFAALVLTLCSQARPVDASVCNISKTLALLRQGQTQSVEGDKARGLNTEVAAAPEAWICYQDHNQSSTIRGNMGKASADILNGAAQDADAIGNGPKAVRLALQALSEYKTLARDRTIPLQIRVYADSAVQAATSP